MGFNSIVMKRITIIILGLFLVFPSLTEAQHIASSDSYDYIQYENLNTLPDSNNTLELKERRMARSIALASTFGPFLLGIVPGVRVIGVPLIPIGFLAGPSMGYIYTDNGDKILRGTAIRAGGAALFSLGAIGAFVGGYGGDQDFYAAGIVVMLSGIGIYTYRFFYDIVHSMRLVDEYNANIKDKKVQLAPSFHPKSKSLGMTLRVNF